MGNPKAHRPRRAVVVSMAGLALIAAYAVAGALQTLVWNPLAAVPGASLSEIQVRLAGTGGSLEQPVVLAWAAVGVVLAALVLVVAVWLPAVTPPVIVAAVLWLIALGAPSHWYAAFGAGLSLADAYGISGAAYAPWGAVLYLISAAAFLGLIATALRTAVFARRSGRVRPSLG